MAGGQHEVVGETGQPIRARVGITLTNQDEYYLNSAANTRPGVAKFTEDWENLFFSRKKGFTTEMYLSMVRVTVRYTLDVIVVCK